MGEKLTEKQRQLAEDNHKLIYSFMKEHKISEEYYGELACRYCACLRRYDEKQCALSTYVYKCLHNEWLNINKKKFNPCRYIPPDQQYQFEFQINEDVSIADVVGAEDKAYDEVEETQLITAIKEYLRKYHPYDAITEGVFDYILKGYNCSEVSRIYGVSRQSINARFNKLKKIYEKVKEEWE